MADITNPEAIKFCNEKVRTYAALFGHVYYQAKRLYQEWTANSLADVIPNTTDPVIDGSASDGRHPITGAMATNIVVRASEIITDMEANSNAKLNTILSVAGDYEGVD